VGLRVDIHTHTWDKDLHCTPEFLADANRMRVEPVSMTVHFDQYMQAMGPVDRCVVFGLKGRHSGVYVPNEYVAAFVRRAPEKMIGFLSVDPHDADFFDDFEEGHETLGLRGVKLGPIYANFDPTDRRLDTLYSRCQKMGLPILFHMGTTFVRDSPLKHTRPYLIDEVASRFPGLKMVIAHLGHPWEGETIVTIRKHPNVFADISAIFYRPWQLYNSLTLVDEYVVWDKVLFGSDYPVTTPDESYRELRALNDMLEGTKLPRVSHDRLDEVFERDSLSLLGLD
jgi:predicted TIM-barrel fold metal-dependent hydrolase